MTQKLPHITVCICTFKRLALLKRLLEELGRQETDSLFTYSIVVADNDEAESAKTVVSDFATVSHIPVRYCVQPRRNIALTRNKAIENAEGEFIAFIDDDEFPIQRWLVNLFNACKQYQVNGVLGPVMPDFDKAAPRWVVKGGFYDRPAHPTGLRLNSSQTRTGNVLIDSQSFKDGHRFNPELLAASDQEFFKRLIAKGQAFIWCSEAVVYEVVPLSRCKRAFLMRRALFRGIFSEGKLRPSASAIATSLVAVPAYTAALPLALALGQAWFMKSAFKLTYHLGRLLAVLHINPIKQPYVTE